MSEQQPGLRFDIYERVHLQENLAAIQELNEVELLPHIQVITLDDQAILKGNLLLTGNYFSEEGGSPRTLEHLIPVEITLPLNRIHRVEDIQVEIENFDIDLLSARSLECNRGSFLARCRNGFCAARKLAGGRRELLLFIKLSIPRSEPVIPYAPEPVPAPAPIAQEPQVPSNK